MNMAKQMAGMGGKYEASEKKEASPAKEKSSLSDETKLAAAEAILDVLKEGGGYGFPSTGGDDDSETRKRIKEAEREVIASALSRALEAHYAACSAGKGR